MVKSATVLTLTVFLLLILWPTSLLAQNCNGSISGVVKDKNNQPIPGVVVSFSHAKTEPFITDSLGRFYFKRLCSNIYILSFNVSGYKPLIKNVTLYKDTVHLSVKLEELVQHLAAIKVSASRESPIETDARSTLSPKALAKSGGDDLGTMLKQIPGVSALQSGPTLSKPAIHGLSGNRVLIMNNGVRQEGQQWGDDHAPEIDPNKSGEISVIKGAASIRYGSDALGGVVLMNPLPLPSQPGINGSLSLVGASNGRKGVVSGDLEGAFDKAFKGLSWRLQGTLKRAGNARTPLYYLDNTGLAEGDFSAQLGYKWKQLELNASYSEYNAKVGIFSGSEVEDSADLIRAYQNRDHPESPDYFTYHIGQGHQSINHDILKLKGQYHFANKGQLQIVYSLQRDLRQEYSPDAPDSSGKVLPDDWFRLMANSLDLIYKEPYSNGFSGSLGFSGQTKNNEYQGLDSRPLIPDYDEKGFGLFAIERYEKESWLVEGGLRYDYLNRSYRLLDLSDLSHYSHNYRYENATGSLGATLHINNRLSFNANFSMGWRAPSADEMFIYGVHASAAQFVMGDSTLKLERSYNSTFTLNYHTDKLKISADLYDNEINDFIYLEPVGAQQIGGLGFHAFQYVQNNVRLLGTDVSLQWDILKLLSLDSKTSLLRATNKTLKGGLINMPPAKFQNGLTLHTNKLGGIRQPYFTLENVSVLKQNYILSEQESLLPPPPPAYSLWNINFGGIIPLGRQTLDLNFAVNNLTNKVYSDYMNQFRYFAYDLGLNFVIRAKLTF